MKKINEKLNLYGDNIAKVEQYDFSTANMNEENRIKAITAVASICYQNPKAIGSESLYNRLLAESKGLPSSSFEFVPILINMKHFASLWLFANGVLRLGQKFTLNIEKYGEWVHNNEYLLTNYRALVYDVENGFLNKTVLKHFNTPEECNIIKDYFKVFLFKVDLPTRSQMVRHRISWQELSRRYVSAKRVPFEFYISEKLKDNQKVQDLIKQSEDLYFELLESGIKPQEARRVIPQMGYTQIWGAFMPKQLDNYFKLRLDEHAQWEIRQTAIAMQELITDEGR